MLEFIEPVVTTAAQIIHRTYQAANSVSCSYLIFNLINFWNLSLLYTFLQIKTLPNYIYNMMEQMSNLLFTRNTLILWLTRVTTGKEKEIDTKLLSET